MFPPSQCFETNLAFIMFPPLKVAEEVLTTRKSMEKTILYELKVKAIVEYKNWNYYELKVRNMVKERRLIPY